MQCREGGGGKDDGRRRWDAQQLEQRKVEVRESGRGSHGDEVRSAGDVTVARAGKSNF